LSLLGAVQGSEFKFSLRQRFLRHNTEGDSFWTTISFGLMSLA
jgi:hypothetical protein